MAEKVKRKTKEMLIEYGCGHRKKGKVSTDDPDFDDPTCIGIRIGVFCDDCRKKRTEP